MFKFQVPKDSEALLVNDVENLLGIASGTSYMISNGHVVSRAQPLQHGCIYYIFPRVLGGKGGFGSMLRAIGAQIEKTTSREACRDLSGRRIRDVNNEKKLKEWVSKQADREREKQEREERRRAKRAKYLEDTPAKMDNPEYDAQYSQIMEHAKMAMEEGLSKLKDGEPTSRKRKAETSSALDKYDRWSIIGGVSADGLDSDSGSENSDSNDAGPSTSSDHPSHTVSSSVSSSPSASMEGAASMSAAGAAGSSTAPATVTSSSETPAAAVDDAPQCKLARIEMSATRDDVSSSSQVAEASHNLVTASEGADASSKESKTSSGAASSTLECTDPVDLDDFTNAEDLQALGLERLKADLMRRGLKCGGSLQERAQRLFSIKGLSADEIPAKLLAKGKGQGKSSQK